MASPPVDAAQPFDPYYTWLGIPPDESAGGGPNFYRLLGLVLFESNPDVIDNAADRQMLHLRSFQTGIHAADSQRLLNEIATARIRLLDPAQKAVYDAELQRALAAIQAASQPRPVEARPVEARPAAVVKRGGAQVKPRSTKPGAAFSTIGIVLGGIAGLGIGSLIVSYMTSHGVIGWSVTQQETGQQQVARPPVPQPHPSPSPEPRPTPRPGSPWNAGLVPPPASPGADLIEPQRQDDDRRSVPDDPSRSVQPPPAESPRPPPPAAAPTTEPRRPAYLFAAVPSNFALPTLITSEAKPLLRLAYEPDEPLMLAIDSSAANLPAGSAIVAEADPQGRGWIVSFLTDAAAAAGRIAMAVVRREGLVLSFAWTAPLTDSEFRRQLANCLLEVGTVKDARVIQLREPTMAGPLVLNLEDDRQIVELELPDPPASARLNFKIVELSGFERGGKPRGASSAPLGKTVFIDFADMKGAQVELRFVRQPTTGKLQLRSEPVFKEAGDKEFELTLPRLEKFQAGHENSLAKANTELPILKKNLSDAQAAVRSLQSRQSANIQEEAMRRPQISAAIAVADRIGQRIGRAQRQIAESQSRLKAVPDVRSFIQSLHKRATVRYVVTAEWDDKVLVLVDGQNGSRTSP